MRFLSHLPTAAVARVLSGFLKLQTKHKLTHILINVLGSDRESQVPVPPAGHRWKEVRHDNSVTWLASWTENIQSAIKYVMLNANSKLKVTCN